MSESTMAELLRSRASAVQLTVLDRTAAIAADLGMAVYLVGGVVRDLLAIGRLHDLDLTVEGDAVDLARLLAGALGARLRIHERFATAEITVGGERVDLVTARTEEYPEPAGLPRVSPGDLEDDLRRRDFTVNAMAIGLWPRAEQGLIDPFDGRSDLGGGRLRVLHDRSFLDDPTRIVRGARLGARLGLEFEAHTAELAVAAVAGGAFVPLSGTRLRREIALLFDDQRPSESLRMLERFGFHGVLERADAFTPDDFDRLAAIVHLRRDSEASSEAEPASLPRIQWWLASLIGLFRGQGRKTRRRLAQRLHMEGSVLESFVESGERLARLADRLAQSGDSVGEVGALVDRLSPEERVVARVIVPPEVRQRFAHWLDRWETLDLVIGGQDLIAAGFRAGPQIGRALEATLAARRDGRIEVDEELEFAIAQLGSEAQLENDR